MANANAFGATGEAKQRTTGGSGGRDGRDTRVSVPAEETVNYILAAVNAGDGLAEFPLHREEAVSVDELAEQTDNETVTQLLNELPDDVETLSFEDFFGLDLEEDGYEYIGTEPKLNETDKNEWSELSEEEKEKYQDEDIYKHGDPDKGKKAYMTAPDWVEVVRENKIDGESVYEASTVLNGHFYPEIFDTLTEEQKGGLARLAVGVGKSYNNEDEFAKRKHVSFSIQEGKSTADRVLKAVEGVGNITAEDKEKWQSGEIDNEELVDAMREAREEKQATEA